MHRILCVEDSDEIQLILKRTFTESYEVVSATTIEAARKCVKESVFNLMILDIGLPDGDGLRFCSELKNSSEYHALPIFILTGNQSIQEKTLGFQLGIEDFVVKPFNPVELKLRVDSRLKKIQDQQVKSNLLSIGNLRIDLSELRASIQLQEGVVPVELSSTEFKILVYLARNREQVKSRDQIITAIWGNGIHVTDRTIDSHVSRIRKKLSQCTCRIEAVLNSGYRFSTQEKLRKAS